MKVIYTIDGVNLKTYGVYVSSGTGFLGLPKRKAPETYEYPDENGFLPDLSKVVYEKRDIILDCFMKADSAVLLASKFKSFSQAMLSKTQLARLVVSLESNTVIFAGDVYVEEISQINKQFSKGINVGTFKIDIVEPQPNPL